MTKTLSNRLKFRAQDPGFEYGAATEDHAEEDDELYPNEHGNEAHELHRSEEALFSAWRAEEDLKLRELMHAKERAPSTPTTPNGSRKVARLRPLSPRVSSTAEPPRGGFEVHEDTTAILRPSEDARPLPIYSRHFPSTRGPPPLTRTALPFLHPPLEGIARTH